MAAFGVTTEEQFILELAIVCRAHAHLFNRTIE